MDAGHLATGLLGDQGRHRDRRAHAGGTRPARPQRPGRFVLAGVRRERQGRHPRALAAVPPGGPGGPGRAAPRGGRLGLGPDDGGACGPAPAVDPGHGTRLPRPDLGLAGRRGGPAGLRPDTGPFLRRRDRRPLGLDFHIGLPASARARVSRMAYRSPSVDLTTVPATSVPAELREQVAAWRDPDSLSNRAFAVTDPAAIDFDAPEVQAAELLLQRHRHRPLLARMYAATIGEVDGVRLSPRPPWPRRPKNRPTGRTG